MVKDNCTDIPMSNAMEKHDLSRVKPRNKAGELLEFMAAVLAEMVKCCGIEERKASEVAVETMLRLRKEFGGQNLYFPMGINLDHDKKTREVYDKYMQGIAISELASEYGHSIQWIYKMISEERAVQKAEREAGREAVRAKSFERWKREN